MESDAELVRRAQDALAGDLRAFERLVALYQEKILANCRYLTKSPTDAQDLAQEVFIKAYFNLKSFEGRSEFRTWLFRIKVNHCLNFIKKQRARAFVDVADEQVAHEPELRAGGSADAGAVAQSERERIEAILDDMPDTLRIPLLMRDMDGLSYEEISGELRIGLSAVKMRIKRGREEFRARYAAATLAGGDTRAMAGGLAVGGNAP